MRKETREELLAGLIVGGLFILMMYGACVGTVALADLLVG